MHSQSKSAASHASVRIETCIRAGSMEKCAFKSSLSAGTLYSPFLGYNVHGDVRASLRRASVRRISVKSDSATGATSTTPATSTSSSHDGLASPAISQAELAARRCRLLQQLPRDSALLLVSHPETFQSHDVAFPFRQSADVSYYTGFPEPCIVVFLHESDQPALSASSSETSSSIGKRTVMFVSPRDPEKELWDGKRVGVDGCVSAYGATEAYPLSELEMRLSTLFIRHHEPAVAGSTSQVRPLRVFFDPGKHFSHLAHRILSWAVAQSDCSFDLVRPEPTDLLGTKETLLGAAQADATLQAYFAAPTSSALAAPLTSSPSLQPTSAPVSQAAEIISTAVPENGNQSQTSSKPKDVAWDPLLVDLARKSFACATAHSYDVPPPGSGSRSPALVVNGTEVSVAPAVLWVAAGSTAERLRAVKSASELTLMQHAADLASLAVCQLMRQVRPGLSEFALAASFEFFIKRRGCSGVSYPCIIAGGNNANVLHYNTNMGTLRYSSPCGVPENVDSRILCYRRNGDLVLADCGADFSGYCSDISRTFPVNGALRIVTWLCLLMKWWSSGTFSEPQRVVYELVLSVQKQCIQVCSLVICAVLACFCT